MASIGDLVPKSGIYTEPGVVTQKHDDGTVTVDTDPMKLNQYHRYANTTGLNEQEKQDYNKILDQIYTKENDVDRINDIQSEIDRLKTDPKSKNVVQYLRNQQAVLVRTAGKLPTTYNWDEAQLKR